MGVGFAQQVKLGATAQAGETRRDRPDGVVIGACAEQHDWPADLVGRPWSPPHAVDTLTHALDQSGRQDRALMGAELRHVLAVVTSCSYARVVRVSHFDWDAGNVSKVEAHDVSPEDVECLFIDGAPVFRPHARTPGRVIALGFVPDGRFVLVVFSYNKRRKAVRVITAYEPTEPAWRSKYEALKR